VIAILIAVLLALAIFLRKRKNEYVEEMFDSSNKNRLPTFVNPTYEAAGGVTVVTTGGAAAGDKTFKAGQTNAMYDWYKPFMSRRDCTEYLMAQGEGAFVVRDSDSTQGWHMLGVKTANRVVHDKIRLTDDGRYELLPSLGRAAELKQPTFEKLPDLVDHYLLNGAESGLGYALVDSNPIYDNHQLIQEREGRAVKAEYNDLPVVPDKSRAYDDVPSALSPASADGVFNPMYGWDQNPAPADGYLEVGMVSNGAAYESI
jgi:hypothetical protein